MDCTPKTGKALLDDIENLEITRKAIVDEFLYERDIFMMAADSGVGKSTITIQLALSLSSGTPLFGSLNTRKARTYVMQVEGDYEESIERMRFMKKTIPVDPDYLCWDAYKKIDISKDISVGAIIRRIRDSFQPEVIIIDPIYKLSKYDICEGEGALLFVNFSDALMDAFGNSNFAVHHNTKDSYIMVDGKKAMKADAYYGHSFIKNHVRTSYALTQNEERSAPCLVRKKGRGSDTLSRIALSYDPDTMTCTMDMSAIPALDRAKAYIKSCAAMGRKTDFYDVSNQCHISHAQLRRFKKDLLPLFTVSTTTKNREVWNPN